MTQYRNKKSGIIITIHGELKGENWEPVLPATPPEVPAEKPKSRRRKKVAENV